MKKSHIVLLFLVAGALVALVALIPGAAVHAGFEQAAAQPERTVRISGTLVPGAPVVNDPELDPNSFRFTLRDKSGYESEVICYSDMPYDFERSDEVVLTGQMREGVFHASDILVKCPSKYVDDQLSKSPPAGEAGYTP